MAVFDLAGEPAPHVYAMAPGRPFFDDLVGALLSDYAGKLDALTAIEIFVPSRRAVRSLKEAFAAQAPSGVILLPRITAVADLSEDDTLTASLERVDRAVKDAPSAAIKRLKLAGIYRDALAEAGEPISWVGALRGASELGKTSDQLTEYGIDAGRLAKLRDEPAIAGSAEHWQANARLLSLVTEAWPAWLAEQDLMDQRERRALLLSALCDRLEDQSDAELILAAGFLGTSPSSEDFLRRVARLPNGAVILPALDMHMPDDAWEEIRAPDPQSAYRSLLKDGFGVPRSHVRPVPPKGTDEGEARRRLLSLALMPAKSTSGWAEAFAAFRDDPSASGARDGLEVAVAKTMEEEADFIALTLRAQLEKPGKTAFLVTADRGLARRVAAKLAGWGIDIDDSGGAPIAGSYRATFLRLIATLMAEPSDPVVLAGLVQHQLFGLGMDAQERRPLVQALDLFLRGRAPRKGWDGLFQSLHDAWRPFMPQKRDEAEELTARIEGFLRRLRDVFEKPVEQAGTSVGALLDAHLEIARTLAATPDENGEERLFRFEDGEVLEPHLAQLRGRPELLGEVPLKDYPELFTALLQGPAFRPPGGQHPRLAIYGILEARLQTADLVVVGGLQEGVWPGDAAVDPFLSRSIRKALGMPSPDAEIGRVAHDFLDFAAQPQVLLTRSERAGRSPARASRLMIRLESFLAKLEPERSYDAAPRLRAWRQARYGADGPAVPAPRPRPAPPADERPPRLSVSAVATWLRDPYAIYAGHVLGLKPLRAYNEAFGARDRGDILHKLLEKYADWAKEDDGLSIEERLRTMLPDVLDEYDMPEAQRVLNDRFLHQAIANFAVFEREAQRRGKIIAVEERGEMEVPARERRILVHGRADRIDQTTEGLAHVIDYKLGGAATIAEGAAFSPQLFLLAMMLRDGGFAKLGAIEPGQVSFIKLTGRDSREVEKIWHPSTTTTRRHSLGDQLKDDLEGFEEKFHAWLDRSYSDETPMTSQLHPYRSDIAGDFDDLARRAEWEREAPDDE
ncbi:double-strand break repair protein AddB [Parvularcula lutaonensis]|uniref:Double-strand break repair protein AddB n=1 Tax=Parvularcula lutaonensis TaxID=491923 RepID=A0ABV7MAK6_9PROT|nr:double-strand break repair protein AddB [Parvularcula lutaonensis]GGY37325.1 double-strand break repair protein AddB [Parvularcula lutaonensis]